MQQMNSGGVRENQVIQAISELQQSIDELDERVTTLISRMTPVLRQEPSVVNSIAPPNKAVAQYSTPLAEIIQQKAAQLRGIYDRVGDASQRLEV